ncbi:MAG TPA: cellulase family glycosylhydrolase [Gemmataceae bacterium]|nr:cellulase family glycosylhydrolase [Gemmataceae bacterium]
MNRRQFLQVVAATAGAGSLAGAAPPQAEVEVAAAKLPRWRGFNLLEKFTAQKNAAFVEADFAWLAEWGFNFVRLPLSYHCWSDPKDWKRVREPVLKEIDQALDFGRQYRVHVNLNFHRAPGYCVNPPAEPMDLWADERAREACAYHWGRFAQRYKGVANTRLSFDLLNEPGKVPEETYVRVVRRLVEAIREEDPRCLIIADGLEWGTKPVTGLAELKIAQSTRGYDPMEVSHYKASWVKGSDRWPEPTWPLEGPKGEKWDRDWLRRRRIEPWQALERKGVGVHVGEWGAHQDTPHQAVLAWMRDGLELWKEAGWGWALWNFRGSFGILDSGRRDVAYEEFKGHKLDRKMLELLRSL